MAVRSLGHMLTALLVLLCLATGAAAAVQVRVAPGTSGGTVGSTVTVTVEADSVSDLGGFQFGFGYSTADLLATAVTINPAFDQVMAQDLGGTAGTGLIAATVFANAPASGTPVTLATIDFTVLTPGVKSITLTGVILGQVGGTEIPSTALGGTITGISTDTTRPADGTLTATPGIMQNALSWDGFTDGGGIASYRVVFDTAGTPADCASGTPLYSGTGTSFLHSGLATVVPYNYRVCAVDNAGNISMGATATATPTIPTFTVSFAAGANGSIAGLTPQVVLQGGSTTTVSATADSGYHFVNWTGTNGFTATTNPLVIATVTADMTVTATFAVDLDTTLPAVTVFTLPSTATTLTVPVTGFTATDNVAVTGYLLSELSTPPPVTDPAWTTAPPTDYSFTAQGARTLYAFARDGSGNISGALPATVVITLPDTTPPTVTAFALPSGASSLTVAVTGFTATDDVGVAGYLLSEVSTQPQPTDPGWSSTAQVSYTFASQGARTLYAFARDASGNVSGALSATVVVALPDTTPPTVTGFVLPTTASALTVPITAFTASDDTGVTGYLVGEISTGPALYDSGWLPTPAADFTFTSPGVKTLHAYARDAAGNVSAGVPGTVTIVLPDTTPPVVTGFTLPVTATSLTVPIDSLTASDDTAVTGYLLSESSTTPPVNDPAWSAGPFGSYTFSLPGAKTLHAFAKDAAGNVSLPMAATVEITLPDTTPPVVASFAIPATSGSLTVAISSFTASDDLGVAGYFVTESTATPLPSDAGWTSTPSASFTFSSSGVKVLRAYAKDPAGNVSAAATATVTITLPDTAAPVVDNFTMPVTWDTLSVPVTALHATDDGVVAGYILSESSSPPAVTDPAWSATPPVLFAVSSPGTKAVFAFAKDGAGNVSAPVPATVTVTLPDTVPPTDGTLGATAGVGQALLSWSGFSDTGTGIAGYTLVYAIGALPTGCGTGTALYAGTASSWSHSGLTAGVNYYYRLCATDVAGNRSAGATVGPVVVTAATTDTTAPSVITSAPMGFGMPVDGLVTVTFSEAMSLASVAGTTFTVNDLMGTPVAGVVGYDSPTKTATFTPAALLSTLTRYTATISGATDLAGNGLPLYSWSFLTAPGRGDGHMVADDGSQGVLLADAVRALNIAVGKINPTATDLLHGDVAPLIDGKSVPDGKIDIGDAIVILRKVVGLVVW